jgi:hypothetical protein
MIEIDVALYLVSHGSINFLPGPTLSDRECHAVALLITETCCIIAVVPSFVLYNHIFHT